MSSGMNTRKLGCYFMLTAPDRDGDLILVDAGGVRYLPIEG